MEYSQHKWKERRAEEHKTLAAGKKRENAIFFNSDRAPAILNKLIYSSTLPVPCCFFSLEESSLVFKRIQL